MIIVMLLKTQMNGNFSKLFKLSANITDSLLLISVNKTTDYVELLSNVDKITLKL